MPTIKETALTIALCATFLGFVAMVGSCQTKYTTAHLDACAGAIEAQNQIAVALLCEKRS